MKGILLTSIYCFTAFFANSQSGVSKKETYTLDALQNAAVLHYPLLKQKELLKESNDLSVKNINTSWLPQVSINGQATYQSSVPSLPIDIPHVKIPTLDKDHYQLTLDAQQIIYDGGTIKSQKGLQMINNKISGQQVEVELYQLKDRVNQLFFAVLMAQQNDTVLALMANDVHAQLKQTENGVKGGVALASTVDILKASLISIDQKQIENEYAMRTALEMLSILTGKTLTQDTDLEMPRNALPDLHDTASKRPEYILFNYQKDATLQQQELIKDKYLPRIYAFGQAGFGKPGFDYFSNDFKPFYIAGIKAGWSLTPFYTGNRELQIQKISADMVMQQKATLDENLAIALKQNAVAFEKYEKLMDKDQELIDLRKRITHTLASQMQNGVITATDYVVALDAESQADQNLRLHKLQLQMAIINYRNTLGK